MEISARARKRLAGLWGSYDFNLIRDKHFATPSDLVERFLERFQPSWKGSSDSLDQEFESNATAVRALLEEWAERRMDRIGGDLSVETLRTHIMFKELHYGRGCIISFGASRTGWKKKTEIAAELARYRPWSIDHAISVAGGRDEMLKQMCGIVATSGSPSEARFFQEWWRISPETDRPMLFPQVQGHTSGKFWKILQNDMALPIHFDFGLVNVVKRAKVIIECDSRSYHSTDDRYQSDRDRQNVAERAGWSVRRFTFADVMDRIDQCFQNMGDTLFYR